MNAITSIENFRPVRSLSLNEIKNVLLELTGLNGITSLNVESDAVMIEYYQQFLSPEIVRDALIRAGFPFQHEMKKQGVMQKFILELGQENKKEFGGKLPKCCR